MKARERERERERERKSVSSVGHIMISQQPPDAVQDTPNAMELYP